MFKQILQLQNILTKDNILVYPSTESVDSSYGLECWIDKDNNSYGQVQFGVPFGFIQTNEFIISSFINRGYSLDKIILKDKNNSEYKIFVNDWNFHMKDFLEDLEIELKKIY